MSKPDHVMFAVAANFFGISPSKFFGFRTWVNTTLKGLGFYLPKNQKQAISIKFVK